MYDPALWTNEGLNRRDKADAENLARDVAKQEKRIVEVGFDFHGGYPGHYYVMRKTDKHRPFGKHAFFAVP